MSALTTATTTTVTASTVELEWIPILDSNCWPECGGGSCQACMNYESNVISAYCCSGANHYWGWGPIYNEDCPADAILAQTSQHHTCVVSKRKGDV